jgi:hypothetical protein
VKTIILAAILAVVAPATGWSQITHINNGSSSNSGAASQSGALSASPNTNQIGNNSPVSNNYPADQTIRSAPTLYAPSIITGNVCAMGASGGVSFIGTGVTAGGTWESQSCEDRQRAALLASMGYKTAAKEYLCASDRKYYYAMRTSGDACAVRPEWEPAATTQAVAPAAPVRAAQAGCPVRTLPNGQQAIICQ